MHKSWLSILFLALAVASISVGIRCEAAPSAKFSCYLEQQAPAGSHKVHITDEGMSVVSEGLDAGLQYTVADKSVTVWSIKKHVYYVVPLEVWLAKFRNLYAAVTWYSEMVKPLKVVAETKNQLNFHTYTFRIDGRNPTYWSSDIGQKDKASGPQEADVTTLVVPLKSADIILSKFYGMPNLPGIPYRIYRRTLNSNSLTTVRLDCISKKAMARFSPSKEYKKVDFSNQIIGPSFDQNMTDLILPY